MKRYISGVIAICVFAACQDAGSSVENISFDSSVVTKSVQSSSVVDTAAAPALPVANGGVIPPATIQNLPAVPAGPAVAVNAGAAGINPAHGQPGHRCDIAVGAPLNSAPSKITAPQVTTSPTTAPAVPTAPGMNPPHGQPGHRCEIAVGAPLNSVPAKTATTEPAKPVAEATNAATPATAAPVAIPTVSEKKDSSGN